MKAKTFNRKLLAGILVLLIAMLAIAGHFIASYIEKQDITDAKKEAIEYLESNKGSYFEDKLILNNTSPREAKALAELVGAELKINAQGTYAVLTLREGTTVRDIYESDEYDPFIKKMSPDVKVYVSELETPKPQATPPSLTFDDAEFENQEYLDYLNIGTAWNSSKGSGVTVAIIDTGIDTDNPDFIGRVSSLSYNSALDKRVCDFDIGIIEDTNGHGTAVAAIIGANANDGVGVAGIAPEAELLVIKTDRPENDSGELSSGDINLAIYYAIECDVDVINMSLSANGPVNPFKDAIKLAYDSDIICVTSAGNDSSAAIQWPAADENAIGVGALADDSFELADYSNYGENVNLCAPGTAYTIELYEVKDEVTGEVLEIKYRYALKQGTSMSAPMVSAAVALHLGNHKYQRFDDVREMLEISSFDIGELGPDWYFGYGALDIGTLITGEVGTVTFNYLTDEIENTKQKFIRGRTLQNLPIPEREYMVFEDWFFDIETTNNLDWYRDPFGDDLTLYASWINEDEGVPYIYVILDDGTVEIREYTGKRRYITMPSVIEDRPVTRIGRGAFRDNTRLREVVLPDTLKEIDDYAFARCTALMHIELPGTLESIGEYAFYECTRLSSVGTIGNGSLKSIGDYAFGSCGALTRFDIPAATESLTAYAFLGASNMKTVTVDGNSTHFKVLDGALANYGGSEIIYFPAGIYGTYTVPAGVLKLGEISFIDASISHIVIGEDVAEIGASAFKRASVYRVDVGDALLTIGASAFEESKVSDITFTEGARLEVIGAYAFYKCENLKEIELPEGLKTIGGSAFSSSALRRIHIPRNVESLGAGAFKGSSLQYVTFAEDAKLTEISGSAFEGCGLLTSVELPSGIKNIGGKAFSGTSLRSIEFPEGLLSIGGYAFSGTRLYEVNIPAKTASVGAGAFASCHALINIYADEGNEAYESVDGVLYSEDLKTIHTFPAGREGSYKIIDGVETVGESAFDGSVIESVDMFDTVTHIGYAAFMSAKNMTAIRLSNELLTLSDRSFMNCSSLTEIKIPDKVKEIPSECFAMSGELSTVLLPAELNKIGTRAFIYCSALSSARLPDKLEYIGSAAFAQCSALRNVIFPDSLLEIGGGAFTDCLSIHNIHITKNIRLLGAECFSGCWNMSTVTFAKDSVLRRLSFGSFKNSGIRSFTVPKFINAIAQYEFSGCKYLRSVSFEEGSELTALTAYMFAGADELAVISFPESSSITSIQAHALEGIPKLRSINLEALTGLTNIDNYAFRYCEKLANVSIPEGVKYIGRYAFMGCYALSELSLPSTLEYIGESAFYATNNIKLYFAADTLPEYVENNWDKGVAAYSVGVKEVISTDSWQYALLSDGTVAIVKYLGSESDVDLTEIDGYCVSQIGGSAFADNTVITSVRLPEGLGAIYNGAFKGTVALKEIVIPASVRTIESNAFSGSGIERVTFGEGSVLSIIGQYAFAETSALTEIAIPDSVTEIRDFAFYNSALTGISFGEDSLLKSVGEYAFAYSGISSFDFPPSLGDVGSYAFAYTAALSSVDLSSGVEVYLWSNAFYNAGIRELYIPDNVRYIGESVFSYCANLESIEVSPDSINYSSQDGALFNKEKTKLITYPAGKTGVYTVPSRVVTLGVGAFEGAGLTGVIFPENSELITIGYRAFINAKSLESIVIPDSIISIDFYAFAYCDNLKTVSIGEGSQLSGIYEGAFYNCKNLTSIYIPEGIQEIAEYSFFGCTRLTDITFADNCRIKGIYYYAFAYSGLSELPLPDGLIEIGDYAFADMVNVSLTVLTVPDSIEVIGYRAFAGQTNIEELTIPGTGELIEYYFGGKLNKLKKVTVTRGEIAYGMFSANGYDGGTIESVTICEGVTSIGSYAFSYQSKLTSIIIPDTVTHIGSDAFYFCRSLENVKLSNALTTLESYTFFNSAITEVILPESLVYLDTSAFLGSPLRSLHINKNLCEIKLNGGGGNGFSYIGFSRLTVDEDNPFFTAVDNVLYSKDMRTLVYVPTGVDAQNVLLDTTLEIAECAFYNNCATKHISLPEGITEIPTSVFSGSDIESVTLPESLRIIGASSFYCCLNLQSIDIPENVEIIRSGAFLGAGLKTVELPKSLRVIEGSAFFGADLEFVLIPENVTEVGGTAFGWIWNKCIMALEADELPSGFDPTWFEDPVHPDRPVYFGIKEVGEFEGFTYLADKQNRATLMQYSGLDSKVTIPEKIGEYTVTFLGDGLFEGQSNLSEVVLPNTIKSIGSSAFYNCTSLYEIVLPSELEFLGNDAFAGSGLYYVELPNTLEKLPEELFRGCNNLSRVVIPNGVQSIGDLAFANCSALQYVIVPNTVTEISKYSFDESGVILFESDSLVASSLQVKENYVLGFERLEDDGSFVFALLKDKSAVLLEYYGTDENVTVPSNVSGYTVSGVGKYVFKDNTSVKTVVLPDTIQTVGEGMFFRCSDLTSVLIPDSVKAIGDRAFYHCDSLKNICIPKNIIYIGDNAFYRCNSLTSINIEGYPIYVGSYAFASSSNKTVRFNMAREELGLWSDTWANSGRDYGWDDNYWDDSFGNINILWGNEAFDGILPDEGLKIKIKLSVTGMYVCILGYDGNDLFVPVPPSICSIPVLEIDESELHVIRTSYIYIIPESVQSVILAYESIASFFIGTEPPEYSEANNSYYGVKDYGIKNNVVYCVDGANAATAVYIIDKTAMFIYIADEFNGYPVKKMAPRMFDGIYVEILRLPLFYSENNLEFNRILSSLKILVIGPNCISVTKRALSNHGANNQLVIYCYQDKNAVMWDDGWNEYRDYGAMYGENPYKTYTTYYLGEWNEVAFYDVSGKLLDYYPLRSAEIVRQPAELQLALPSNGCISYEFVGWDLNGDGIADVVPTQTGIGIDAYPLYKEVGAHTYTASVTAPTCRGKGYTTHTCHCGDSYKDSYVDALGHSYTSKVIAPTCTEKGYTTHTCHCGDSYKDSYVDVDALAHTAGAPAIENRVYATCTEKGHYDSVIYCSVCKTELERSKVEIPVLAHTASAPAIENRVNATCTEKGHYERVTYCFVCENEIERKTIEIPMQDHRYMKRVIRPTCTEEGYTEYTCKCGDSYKDSYVDARGHKAGPVLKENMVLATCTGKGHYDSVIYCSVCKTELERSEVEIPVLGHTVGAAVEENRVDATCTEKGHYERVTYCSVCKDEIERKTIEIPMQDHRYMRRVIRPTCTEEGYTEYTCKCGDSYKDTYVDARGHVVGPVLKENMVLATCTGKGHYDSFIYCSVCKTELERSEVEIPALGHTVGAAVEENRVDATCTEKGYYDSVIYCSVCKTELERSEVEIPALGHTAGAAVEENRVDATCTEKGHYELVTYCSVCKDEIERKIIEIPMQDHRYVKRVIAPTCTEKGYTEYTCKCGDSYKDSYVDARGHRAGAAAIENRVDATCTEKGHYELVKYCFVCENEIERKTIEIPMQDHRYVKRVIRPTCTEEGYTEYTCKCGLGYKENYVAALGHHIESHSAQAPTYTDIGWEAYESCFRCDYTTYKELPALGLAERFKEELKAINAESLEGKYNEITSALRTYNSLSDSEKETVSAEYSVLVAMVEEYNDLAESINNAHYDSISSFVITLIDYMDVFSLAYDDKKNYGGISR